MSGQTAGQTAFRADRLRDELARTDRRPVNLAVELDVGSRTVERWVAGHREPNGSNVRRLARLFDRHPDFFFDADSHDEPKAA